VRVAVFGASGFVGSTLVEHLWATGEAEVRAIIHSTGSAARLARHGRPLVVANLMAPDTIGTALESCTHVVNCSRGPGEVMTRGLQHLLDASRRNGVQRLVHLSSVAAYGDVDRGGVVEESAAPAPAAGTYGQVKLRQDEIVAKAERAGLSCAVLCPPNISGAYSPFLLEIVESIRRREFTLVNEGRVSCELVDVANLVQAICLALRIGTVNAERIFITDGASTTWAQVAQSLAPMADIADPLPSIPLDEASRLVARAQPAMPSFRRAMRHLLSSEVRAVLRRDPWFAQVLRTGRTALRRIPQVETALRKRVSFQPDLPRSIHRPLLSARLLKQQLRSVSYSQDRARQLLGYAPVVDFQTSMARFSEWYRRHYGWGDESWTLLRHLRAENLP